MILQVAPSARKHHTTKPSPMLAEHLTSEKNFLTNTSPLELTVFWKIEKQCLLKKHLANQVCYNINYETSRMRTVSYS